MLPLRRLTLLNLFGVRGPPPVHDGARTETGLAPTPAPDAPSPLLTRDVFRITEIPITATAKDLSDAISLAFAGEQITLDDTQTTLCPSPDQRSQTAIVQFQPGAPRQLINLKHRDVFDELFVGGRRVGIDKDFHGLTQMYQTSGLIKADIVAVCGLNGHAYGSWAGKKDSNGQRRMWLHHFLAEDLPDCRTMIYGYDSSLRPDNQASHTIPDYTERFLEELKKARKSPEEQRRPIIFIGHSFGGTIIVQALVKAKEDEEMGEALFQQTRATLFFGTPHRGMLVDDILNMIGDRSQRLKLVESLTTGSEELRRELERFINYSVSTDLKIVNFKEKDRSRKLKQDANGVWSRSGDFFTAVEELSSVLQLPRSIEKTVPVDGDHSTMVKFKVKGDPTYKTVVSYLEEYIATNGPVSAYKATKARNTTDLSRALKQGNFNINEMHEGGITLLHLAVANSDRASAELLMLKGANTEVVNKSGETPLHIALQSHDYPMVDLLLDHGANIDALNNGMTALHNAALVGDRVMAGYLLDKGSDTRTISTKPDARRTPLIFAVSSGVEMITFLLDRGADVNGRGVDMDTPLHHASWVGSEEMVNLLLSRGADIHAMERSGLTPLHSAALRGHLSVVKILSESGAGFIARDPSQQTVLHLAALSANLDNARRAVAAGSNLHTFYSLGQTALHLARQARADRDRQFSP